MLSDSEDMDLENLRQAALSSLLKKKSVPPQTNALFYRPVSNSNLISIQPIKEVDEDERNENESDRGSSSGSEYAVIEEGLSVSSGDVDQVIEEIIVSGEENNVSEEEAEDAVSIASHDSFDEILNSVEEELRGSKRRTTVDGHAETCNKSGHSISKRPRRDSARQVHIKRKSPNKSNQERRARSRSPASRDPYRRDNDKGIRLGSRRPVSPNSPDHPRSQSRRSKSPIRNLRRQRSPVDRKGSNSPIENKNPRSISRTRRKSPSPITSKRRPRSGSSGARDYSRLYPSWKDGNRRPNSRSSRSLSKGGSDNEKSGSKSDEIRRPYDRRRSADRRRSRSPRNKLSFGDHRLRAHVNHNNKLSSRNSSRHTSRERTKSPLAKRHQKSKSPEGKRNVKVGSPTPNVDTSNLSHEERARLEKRKLKFQSRGVTQSGKVILKPKENAFEDNRYPKPPKVPITFESSKSVTSRRKRSTENPPVASRLGRVLVVEKEDDAHRQRDSVSKSKSKSKRGDLDDVEDLSNNNSEEGKTSPQKSIGKDDLRTKLQQKRAANVGRLFSTALKETLHKDKDSSTSPRN